jgi:hypothetical protein
MRCEIKLPINSRPFCTGTYEPRHGLPRTAIAITRADRVNADNCPVLMIGQPRAAIHDALNSARPSMSA